MSRGNQILTAVLVVQLALIALVFWPRSAEPTGGALLFKGLDTEKIVQLTVYDPVEGQIRLAKVTGEWVLPGADDFACKEGAVSGVLDKVASLQSDRLVAETKASHERLQVAEENYVRMVVLSEADGTTYTLYLGSAPSYGAIHARVGREDQVYLVSGVSSADVPARAAGWIDTAYLTLQQDQVVDIVLENANGQFAFTRPDAEGAWTMAGLAADEALNEGAVNSLLSQVSSVRMMQPLGLEQDPGYGLDDPTVAITVRTRDAEGETAEYRLLVGAQRGDEGAYYAKGSTSPYYVTIAAYTADGWIARTREAFLQLPPTPTPAS
jgi:hypothetical protein